MINHQEIESFGQLFYGEVRKFLQASFLPVDLDARVTFSETLSRGHHGEKAS
jgi:hypothetical protein